MHRFRTIVTLAVGLSLASPAAAAPACMTEPEVNALVAYMAPPVLRGASRTCVSSLGGGSYLAGNGTALIAQYQVNAERSWPQAKSAMLKLMEADASAGAKLLAGISDRALREVVDAGFVQALTDDIKVQDCPKIDRLVRSLGALPPEPVTQLISALMTFDKKSPFPLCAAG